MGFRIISSSRTDAAPARSMPVRKGLEDLIEESRRQEAVIVAVAVGKLAQVIAGPEKLVALVDNDP